MSYFTESELREIWKNGKGQLPIFPSDTRFSAAASDFIKSQKIQLRYSGNEVSPAGTPKTDDPANREWDKPGTFPVNLAGPVPVCLECGQPLHAKPEHMTQLDAGHFAPKTNPRLVFRGRVDSLHALVMLVASHARRFELPKLALGLDTLAAFCREIMSAEYNWRPVGKLALFGKNEEELHEISHWPDRLLGIPHLVPGPHDHEIIHWLNYLRTQCREVEIVALQSFSSTENAPDLARALNRLSSAVYVLELFFQSGELSWKVNK